MRSDMNDRLKARRLELGMTMLELSQKAGVSEATISRWESGDIANMRKDKISALANALHVTPGFIMGIDDKAPEPVYLPSPEEKDPDLRMVARKMKDMSAKDKKKLLRLIDMIFDDDDK